VKNNLTQIRKDKDETKQGKMAEMRGTSFENVKVFGHKKRKVKKIWGWWYIEKG
jgi:hypothetical protein